MNTHYALENGNLLKAGEFLASYDSETNVVTSPALLSNIDKGGINKLVREFGKDKPSFSVANEEKEKPAKPSHLPTEPAQDIKLGDKTPAYIAWYKATHTAEEFAAKYDGRKYEEGN